MNTYPEEAIDSLDGEWIVDLKNMMLSHSNFQCDMALHLSGDFHNNKEKVEMLTIIAGILNR